MFKPNSRGGAGDRPLKGWPRHEAAKPILAVHNFCREKPDRTVHPSCPPSRSFRLRRIPTGSRRRARLRLMSRPGSSTEPAGESPVQVSAGASGSRPQFSVERPAAQRGVETLLEETLSILDSLRNKILPLEWRATYVAAVRAHYELHIGLLMAMHRSEPTRGGPAVGIWLLAHRLPGKASSNCAAFSAVAPECRCCTPVDAGLRAPHRSAIRGRRRLPECRPAGWPSPRRPPPESASADSIVSGLNSLKKAMHCFARGPLSYAGDQFLRSVTVRGS